MLLDDVQTRRSAKSLTATEDRVQTIDGDVLGLAGHETAITAVMAVTPIYDGDLACIYLSREQKPEWRGQTAPMVYQMPDALDTLWDQYRQIADDARKNDGDPNAATAFYLAKREEMDAGAIVAWPDGPTSGRVVHAAIRDGPLLPQPPGLRRRIPVQAPRNHRRAGADAFGRPDRQEDQRGARRRRPTEGRVF